MSGHRHEHRHENDPTGNGIVNHGPEKTPHADPDRPDGPHDEGAQREPDESPEPEPGPEPAPSPAPRADGADGSGAESAAGTLTDIFGGGRRGRGTGDGPGADNAGTGTGTGVGTGTGPGTDTGTGMGMGADGELDEVVLRRMLHGAVGDLEPSDRTLEHLQRAVPARRARRRQAVVGAAAAALLIGTAVPAFVHVANSDGPSTALPAIAGHGEQAQGGNGEEPGPQAPGDRTAEPTDQESRGGTGEPDPSGSPSSDNADDPEGGAATGGAPVPPSVDLAALPVCDPGQLGVASAGAGSPDAEGRVYGSFKIANVSGADCTVSSNGTVGFTALGAADPLKINVIQHTAGDAAPGLPDPSREPGTVLLKPSMAYEVQFAWVPADTCPTVAPSPTPTPSADGTGGSTGEGSGQSGPEAQSLHRDGGTVDGSIAVTHTPETGAPTAETKINNACSGTIYRTGVLATS
ncbi:hypothetical protein ACTFBT_17805 [Streptomyces microflavus]|uniref:hypothetical protein n=1 Tax=Streptomyces TaxID=1883 RepID=UPI00167DA8DA|nr:MULTISPECIES: hypothetical protein [Streptomyces]MDX2979872.1 hypothetical protein [Streptomyces sp. NRRL_B-2249]GGX49919.1 hypothetical protein GCM10010298_11630 [Streptomyces microflavus]